jgi:hypothetical protein
MQDPSCAAGNFLLAAAVADILLAVVVTWYNACKKARRK